MCTILHAVFWQSVQLVPVYCTCGLVIDVLRLPVCVYVLFMPKSVIIAFVRLLVYYYVRAIMPLLIVHSFRGCSWGACALLVCLGLTETVASVQGVIVPGCGSDPVL